MKAERGGARETCTVAFIAGRERGTWRQDSKTTHLDGDENGRDWDERERSPLSLSLEFFLLGDLVEGL